MVTKAYCEPLLHQTLLSLADFNSLLSVYYKPSQITDNFDDISQSRIEANRLIRSGYKNVTMFKICAQPPECITWSYVKKYEI